MSEITERILGYVESHKLAPNAPCSCESGKVFGDCCGSTAPDRAPPCGIHIQPNIVPDSYCHQLLTYARKQPKRWLSIVRPQAGSQQLSKKQDEDRVAREVKLGKWRPKVLKTVESNFRDLIREKFDQTLLWFEEPNLLFYSAGGFYAPHADSHAYFAGQGIWQKAMDRDYSMLFYLNDDYEGGHVNFMMFNYRYKPKKGDLILFPSDHRYVHTAEPVTRGNRFAIVSWAAVSESRKVKLRPPPEAHMVEKPGFICTSHSG